MKRLTVTAAIVAVLMLAGCASGDRESAPPSQASSTPQSAYSEPAADDTADAAIGECEQLAQHALHLSPDILDYTDMAVTDLDDAGTIVSGYVNDFELSCNWAGDGDLLWLQIGGIDYTDGDGDGIPDDQE
jgi:hypothetical protein